MKKILTFAFLIALNFSIRAQTHQLSLNLVKDNDYFQTLKTQTSVASVVDGKTMNINLTMTARIKTTVTGIKDNIYNLDISYLSISMDMELADNHIQFDSKKNDQNNALSEITRKLLNRKFQAKMTKTGRLIEVSNLESLLSEVFKGSKLPEAEQAKLKSYFDEFYNEGVIKDNMEAFSAIFPDQPIVKGASWNINTVMKSGTLFNVKSVYKLEDVTNKWYLITGTAKLDFSKVDTTKSNHTSPVRFDLYGDILSTIKIDKNTGWIIEANIVTGVKGTTTLLTRNNQSSKEMSVPMEIKGTTIITGN